MILDIRIESPLISDNDVRDRLHGRLNASLTRFQHRLMHVRAIVFDEHGLHGAPSYRCRLEVTLNDGGNLSITGDHQRVIGATSDAILKLRRHLADQASGIQSRRRQNGRSQRGKGRAA